VERARPEPPAPRPDSDVRAACGHPVRARAFTALAGVGTTLGVLLTRD